MCISVSSRSGEEHSICTTRLVRSGGMGCTSCVLFPVCCESAVPGDCLSVRFAMSTTSFVWACTWNMCGLPVFIYGGRRTRGLPGAPDRSVGPPCDLHVSLVSRVCRRTADEQRVTFAISLYPVCCDCVSVARPGCRWARVRRPRVSAGSPRPRLATGVRCR